MTAPIDDTAFALFLQGYEDTITGLLDRIEQLEAAAPAADTPPAGPPPIARWWRDRANSEDWADLTRWVNDIRLRGSVDRHATVPACWRQHPGLVEDLAGVFESWRNAMLTQATGRRRRDGQIGGGSMETSMWFTQAYWPLLDRLPKYTSGSCATTHADDDLLDQ